MIRQRRRTRAPDIRDESEPCIGDVADQHAVHVRILRQVRRYLAFAVTHGVAIRHLDNIHLRVIARRHIGITCRRRGQNPAVMRRGAATHHQRGALRHVRAQAARVIHVMMREHQVTHWLHAITRLRGAQGPIGLPVVHRRIKHDQVVAHFHHQRIVRAANDVLHAGRELLHAQRLGDLRVKARMIRIKIGADELPADHPLIRNIAHGGPGCGGAQVRGHRHAGGINHGIGRDLRNTHVSDRTAIQFIALAHRHAHAAYGLPLGQHQIVIDITPDIVEIERAHACRQSRGRIEQHDKIVRAGVIRQRRMRYTADLDAAPTSDTARIVAHLQQQRRRGTAQFALRGRQPQTRHGMHRRIVREAFARAAIGIDADHGAGIRCNHLGIGERARRGISEFFHPIDARHMIDKIERGVERCLRREARFATRNMRLLRLPLFYRALDRCAAQAAQCINAAHRRNRAVQQFLIARGRRGRTR